ncbi:hypothetical protein SAMN02949497_3187 [Methylomagnum ishizawai]|uniref:LexA-binding, inner membrane-associated hydrolase n=1 Tax=Methylomagnum ishizawai TaxID=1760988 RepID=A0A1Y6D5I6_9GAMM|nr:metal-dependent hydrolase [Methylomagnum ishizawai]SMF95812.1 hypothetical protein SAMN02949497_3187 [Methylomagnum ishizawai]
MPFTPFHLGPGLALKAVGGRHFSLTLFGAAQVAMDVEPLFHLLRGDAILHGPTHSYAGATLIAFATLALGWPFCRMILAGWNRVAGLRGLGGLRVAAEIGRIPALTGAFLGTYSHVFLDSLMHADMRPWWPFAAGNGLLHAIPVGWLHLLCLGLGGVGGMVLVAVFVWHKIAIEV